MSPGARASLRAGPPPPGPVGGGRRLARRAPPPAPPSLGRSPHGLGRVPAPVPTSRAGEAPGRALDSLRHRPRASPAGHPMPRRARSHRLLSASRLLPVYSRRLLPPRDTHLRSNTQTHSGDSWGPEEPARSGDPPLPAPTLPLPPPAGRVLEWRGLCCCPGVGWGCPGDRMGRRCTRRAGLRDGGCGRESPCPASFQASRGEEGTAKRPGSLPDDKPRGSQALRALLLPLPFLTSPTRALTICSLYFSPFPPRAPTAAEGPTAVLSRPARLSPRLCSCARPWLCSGV